MQNRTLAKDNRGANAVASSRKLSSLFSSVGFGNMKEEASAADKEKAIDPMPLSLGSAKIAPSSPETKKNERQGEA